MRRGNQQCEYVEAEDVYDTIVKASASSVVLGEPKIRALNLEP